MGMIMSSLGWAILLVGLALSADVAWSEYREWRAHPHHQVRPALGVKAALVAAPARGWSARGPEVVRWIIRCCSEYPAGMVQSEAHL